MGAGSERRPRDRFVYKHCRAPAATLGGPEARGSWDWARGPTSAPAEFSAGDWAPGSQPPLRSSCTYGWASVGASGVCVPRAHCAFQGDLGSGVLPVGTGSTRNSRERFTSPAGEAAAEFLPVGSWHLPGALAMGVGASRSCQAKRGGLSSEDISGASRPISSPNSRPSPCSIVGWAFLHLSSGDTCSLGLLAPGVPSPLISLLASRHSMGKKPSEMVIVPRFSACRVTGSSIVPRNYF